MTPSPLPLSVDGQLEIAVVQTADLAAAAVEADAVTARHLDALPASAGRRHLAPDEDGSPDVGGLPAAIGDFTLVPLPRSLRLGRQPTAATDCPQPFCRGSRSSRCQGRDRKMPNWCYPLSGGTSPISSACRHRHCRRSNRPPKPRCCACFDGRALYAGCGRRSRRSSRCRHAIGSVKSIDGHRRRCGEHRQEREKCSGREAAVTRKE